MKRFIADTINQMLSPFGAKIVSERELIQSQKKLISEIAEPNTSALRIRLFRQLAKKGFYPKHIIDVGAHKGHWSLDAYKVFPESYFTLIEPQIEMKPYLDKFSAQVKKSQWILAGAGETEGEFPFTVAPNPDGSSFAVSEEAAKERNSERRMLPIITLDSVCEKSDLPFPEIVKIDAE